MKKLTTAVLFSVLALSAMANLYVPKARLVGESVQVRLSKEVALVTAVFQFEDWKTRDGNISYFPIFAEGAESPIGVLARSGLEFEFDGKTLGVAQPCEPPTRFNHLRIDPRIFWFSADLDRLIDRREVDWNQPIVIKVSYSQPLVKGRFYYLPVISGWSPDRVGERGWAFQMTARSAVRPIRVLSKSSDYELLGDSVIVFLKDGEVVELQ